MAIRNLLRNKIYSAINILGLSFGLACAMLIILYVKDEVSYDRFHVKRNQIFRVTEQMLDEKGHEVYKIGKTSLVQGPAYKQDIPEINDFVRIKDDGLVISGYRFTRMRFVLAGQRRGTFI